MWVRHVTLEWMRDWPANLLLGHQHHVAAMSLNMSNSCATNSWHLLPQTTPSRLMGGESSNFFSQHTAFNDHRWFCISSCWRYCAHNTDFHLQGVDVYFLCVWCRGGGMQERELLSTQPHLPTSAMTLWQVQATWHLDRYHFCTMVTSRNNIYWGNGGKSTKLRTFATTRLSPPSPPHALVPCVSKIWQILRGAHKKQT